MPEDPHWKYFLHNVKLKHEYLVNNYEEKFVTKVNETFLSYQPEILNILQDKSSETDKYLVNFFKTLKITEFDGKNVDTVVSLIQGVFNWLRNMVDASGQIALTEIFPIISSMYLRPPQVPNSTRYLWIIPLLRVLLNFRPIHLTNHSSTIFYHYQKPNIAVLIWSENGLSLALKQMLPVSELLLMEIVSIVAAIIISRISASLKTDDTSNPTINYYMIKRRRAR